MHHALDDHRELTQYLERVADHRLLTHEEEAELATIWASRKKKQKPTREQLLAREQLLTHNVKLVVSIAKHYRNRGLPFIEIIQEGITGLARALETFDPSMGNRLSTYATWWIRQACQRAVAQQGATIRVPAHVNFRRARTYEMLEKNPNATFEEIAAALDCKPHHIEEAMDVVRANFSLTHTNEDGDHTGVADMLADPNSEDPADAVARRDFMREKEVRDSLARIDDDERAVIELRFGFGGVHPHSFAEISAALGIPTHRAQQIQKTALRKLERIMENDDTLTPDAMERRGRAARAASSHTARLAPVSVPLLEEDVDELAGIAEFMRSHNLKLAAEEVDLFIEDILGANFSTLIDEPVLGRCDCEYESCVQEDLTEDELAC